MNVIVNGQPRALVSSRTVSDLVDELQLPRPAVLVEQNGTALFRDDWERLPVSDGDRFEILRVVAGG